jgi:uncharacterized protein YqjF (DUF2071 family)
MEQTWHDLLFAHWPVRLEALRHAVPRELDLDTFEGNCWVGVAPFHMSGICLRGMPAIPGLSRFPELNVRTYVTFGGKRGVYFFSLDAGSLLAVWAARRFYLLPYFHAEMGVEIEDDWIAYRCKRRLALENRNSRYLDRVEFLGRYRPMAPVQLRSAGSLEHWFTERYCLYTVKAGRVHRAEIHHQPWPLQDAEAEIQMNTMALAAGISLPQVRPLLHFAKKLEVLIWPLRRVSVFA